MVSGPLTDGWYPPSEIRSDRVLRACPKRVQKSSTMQIVCPACSTSYDIKPAAIGVAGRQVRCVRCQNVWFVPAPGVMPAIAVADAAAPEPPPAPEPEASLPP